MLFVKCSVLLNENDQGVFKPRVCDPLISLPRWEMSVRKPLMEENNTRADLRFLTKFSDIQD